MADEALTFDKRRQSDHEPDTTTAEESRHGSNRSQQSKRRISRSSAGHDGKQATATTLSQSYERDAPTPPIAVPYHDHASQRSRHSQHFNDGDGAMGQCESHERRDVANQAEQQHPTETDSEASCHDENMSPQAPQKQQLRIRTRGRSLMDEIAKDKFGVKSESMSASRKDRSAAMQVASIATTVPEEAVEEVPALSESMKGSSPPVEELFTPSDHHLEMYASPLATSAPDSQALGSAPSSWHSRKVGEARSSGSVRRTRRSGATPVSASPASAFLRQWSTSSPKVRAEDDEGAEIREYVLGRELGNGAFSLVREAFSSTSPSKTPTLAVKIVRKQVKGATESENEELQAQFEHEIEVWRPLQHANILQMEEVVVTQFATFAFMPLAKGGTLWQKVKAKKNQGIEPNLAKQYAAQIAKALRYLHQDMQLVHRDVKLENCLLDVEPGHNLDGSTALDSYFPTQTRVLLADFGLAEYIPSSASPTYSHYGDSNQADSPASNKPRTEDRGPAGSLHYAAPELLHEKKMPPLDPSVDMWAYGVLLFTLITGNLPFRNDFQPKLVEEIKAGVYNRQLVQSRIDGADTQHTATQSAHSPMVVKEEHSCEPIFRNESWARSCHTIVETEGVPLDSGSLIEVLDGCMNTKYQQRWDVAQLIEAGWLASELRDEIEGGLEMARR